MKNLTAITLLAILIVSCTQTRTPIAVETATASPIPIVTFAPEPSSTPVVSHLNEVLFREVKSNQVKWQSFGISNYQITTKLDDFSQISGTYTFDVKNGEVVKITILDAIWLESVNSRSPQDFYELTIDGLFQNAYDCVSDSPPNSCSFQFNSLYGYPTKMSTGCDDLTVCPTDSGREITILDVNLSPK